MKPLKKAFSCDKTKNNSHFAVNLADMLKEATIHFCLFDERKHLSSLILKIECIEINYMRKDRKKIRSSQASFSINSGD